MDEFTGADAVPNEEHALNLVVWSSEYQTIGLMRPCSILRLLRCPLRLFCCRYRIFTTVTGCWTLFLSVFGRLLTQTFYTSSKTSTRHIFGVVALDVLSTPLHRPTSQYLRMSHSSETKPRLAGVRCLLQPLLHYTSMERSLNATTHSLAAP